MKELNIGNSVIRLKMGDITQEKVDAIVNAANSKLAGGGGVDGAIHRAGGPQIMAECKKYPGCPTGFAVITSGGKLSAHYVIHAVGPYYSGKPKDAELLASAYRKSLELAVEHGVQTISFPAISTGVYRYPLSDAARISLRTVFEFIQCHPMIREVNFVLFNEDIFQVFAQALLELGPHART